MLFHVYGENALPQWIAMLGVLAALILLNEVARRTKAGGILMFFVDRIEVCRCKSDT